MYIRKFSATYGDGLTGDQRYYRRHRKKRIKDNKEYYQEHIDYWKEFNKNRDKKVIKACKHRRRLQGGFLDKKIVQRVYEDNIKKYGTLTCYLCLKPIQFGNDNLEHKTPLSRGGTNEYNNLAIACQFCNKSKNNKTEKEYRKILIT